MSITKEEIETRKSNLQADFQTVKNKIEESEAAILSMKNNLNALAGAIQQCEVNLLLL